MKIQFARPVDEQRFAALMASPDARRFFAEFPVAQSGGTRGSVDLVAEPTPPGHVSVSRAEYERLTAQVEEGRKARLALEAERGDLDQGLYEQLCSLTGVEPSASDEERRELSEPEPDDPLRYLNELLGLRS